MAYVRGVDTPEVEVRRSRRRRRTVSAYREDGRTVVLIPARFTKAEERQWVASMLDRLAAGDRRRSPSDEELAARAEELSRRYLVVVPAGLVVHDPLLLVENALLRVGDLASVRLALADTQAADLTGATAGVAIEIGLKDFDTVLMVARGKPNGNALHVKSVLVSPTRPGRALHAAAARKMPVG